MSSFEVVQQSVNSHSLTIVLRTSVWQVDGFVVDWHHLAAPGFDDGCAEHTMKVRGASIAVVTLLATRTGHFLAAEVLDAVNTHGYVVLPDPVVSQ